jgi:hypothetical protein
MRKKCFALRASCLRLRSARAIRQNEEKQFSRFGPRARAFAVPALSVRMRKIFFALRASGLRILPNST